MDFNSYLQTLKIIINEKPENVILYTLLHFLIVTICQQLDCMLKDKSMF